jgi:signal transduction histidine kinase
LKVDAAADVLKCGVKCDPSAVEQILFNLVDNACKYAANGSPAANANECELLLSVSQAAGGANRGRVELRLADHGPGISREERRRIFQPFRKSAQDAAHSAPGVGLGLSLSRRLARDMNGELEYEPRPDGACFVLTLPLASEGRRLACPFLSWAICQVVDCRCCEPSGINTAKRFRNSGSARLAEPTALLFCPVLK